MGQFRDIELGRPMNDNMRRALGQSALYLVVWGAIFFMLSIYKGTVFSMRKDGKLFLPEYIPYGATGMKGVRSTLLAIIYELSRRHGHDKAFPEPPFVDLHVHDNTKGNPRSAGTRLRQARGERPLPTTTKGKRK
ncbi:Hypothetical protein D9617_4g002630 [Elsinoe fawcettii]|nr:Hypothetical protein D9617_4g002630 [Elsinoe fawcettii]